MLKTYRPDIDGLRGLAILLVVIYHFFPKSIPGGFIGVDIFFVISGYLITSIIFLNLQERKFSIYDFYARRIRRIFPPLFLVLLVVYALGWLSLFALEYQQLGKHIFSGALFFSNITLKMCLTQFWTFAFLKNDQIRTTCVYSSKNFNSFTVVCFFIIYSKDFIWNRKKSTSFLDQKT